MTQLPGILMLLAIGLACWALCATLAAVRWRRDYRRALAQFGLLLSLPAPRPGKSAAHVKGARTREDRHRARVRAARSQLEAEIRARGLFRQAEG